MKKSSIIILKMAVVTVGIGALVLLLRFPLSEGRNANATPSQVYFHDPFLAYIYIASVPFFVALWQVIKLLGLIGRNEAFSKASAGALRIIKYCAMAFVAFIVGAEAWLFIFQRGQDDIAGGAFMGLLLIFAAGTAAIAAAVFEKILQNAAGPKS